MCDPQTTGFEEVEIELTDQEFLTLAKMAHDKDITFNQLCNQVLREHIDKLDNEASDD